MQSSSKPSLRPRTPHKITAGPKDLAFTLVQVGVPLSKPLWKDLIGKRNSLTLVGDSTLWREITDAVRRKFPPLQTLFASVSVHVDDSSAKRIATAAGTSVLLRPPSSSSVLLRPPPSSSGGIFSGGPSAERRYTLTVSRPLPSRSTERSPNRDEQSLMTTLLATQDLTC